MASDAPEDGDPPTLPGPSAATSAAFAATMAPEPSARPRPAEPPARTADGSTTQAATRNLRSGPFESEATLDAPALGELPPLPVVPDAHYTGWREVARG